jgi:hypothetical protein
MRLNDLNGGSIKTLLILVLLFANIAVAHPRRSEDAQPPGSARASRAVFGALVETFSGSHAARALDEAPSAARETRALPDPLRP